MPCQLDSSDGNVHCCFIL